MLSMFLFLLAVADDIIADSKTQTKKQHLLMFFFASFLKWKIMLNRIT